MLDRWREVRADVRDRRGELAALAAARYPAAVRVAGTSLLARSEWLPPEPLPLDAVRLTWTAHPAPPAVTDEPSFTGHLLPAPDLPSYASAVAAYDRPAVFENRSVYRPLRLTLTGRDPVAAFGPGRYFDALGVGAAAAHELAERRTGPLPLRDAIGDPADLSRRPASLALSVLTVRHDRARGAATYVLHWRDPVRVAHAGGQYQVMPVGVFQPSDDAPVDVRADLDLWRTAVREYSEEFLGTSETYERAAAGTIDYDAWPFAARLGEARRAGDLRVSVLGAGVDPLTLAVDLLLVAVFEADAFDELFAGLVTENAEGSVTVMPFDDAFLHSGEPMQAAGEAALRLALAHRGALLTP